MRRRTFDRLLSHIRNEQVEDAVLAQAAERVWNSITASASMETGITRLRSCIDFQTLIPAYLGNDLPEARRLLVADHLHDCVACRHALEQFRNNEPLVWQVRAAPRLFGVWRGALAAVAALMIAAASFALVDGFFPGQHAIRGSVQAVDGSLYVVLGEGVRIISPGYQIRNGDQIRTAKGSDAVLRLTDGSLLEMGERSDVSLSRGWKGTTIHLDGGRIIVQAATQRVGRLYVATGDCLVSVKGTIFSVNHGTKGSRVAVIEGVVRVAYGDQDRDLRASEEATSNPSVAKVPIQNEIAWSRHAARYLALLGDFAILQKQLEAIPGPGLRYGSDLMPYVPDHTTIYAAIPNLAPALDEAGRLFQERLQQSPAFGSWWREQERGQRMKLEDVMDRLKTFSSYLGDEIVFALQKNGSAPVVLARVRRPGLEAFLQAEAKRLMTDHHQGAIEIVPDPSAVSSLSLSPHRPLLLYVHKDVLLASPDGAELERAAKRIQHSIANHFGETPLHEQVVRSYQQVAGWLFCADMEQILKPNVQDSRNEQLPPGMEDIRFLTMERREIAGKTENRATLTFASERRGVASWLAAPAPMGALDFISPDASLVSALVIKNPRTIIEELFETIGARDPAFQQDLSNFEVKTGVTVLDDITAPLGGEVAFAFDGPVLPTPRWKAVLEVYDPTRLQSTIAKLVDSFNREASPEQGAFELLTRQVRSRTYYTLHNARQPGSEINYTFADSYLIAGPDLATLASAIREHEAGNTLTRSSHFQALLPSDGYTNFSALFYHNVGPIVGPLVEQIKAVGNLTAQQRKSIDALQANTAPGLIYAYGEPRQIVVASNTGFMGFDLGTLMTMASGGPFLPQMLLSGAMGHPSSVQ